MGIIKYIKNQIWHDRNTKSLLDQAQRKLNRLQSVIDEMVSQNRMDYLRDKTLYSHEFGISEEKCCENELVVSLTTFGKRIYDVYLAIESIMQGTVKPNRIVLWLSEEEFKGKQLPRTLELQKKRGLQVEYCRDIRSYNKLIPTLKSYPDSCVITIDDDAMYEFDVVERLLNSHSNHPIGIGILFKAMRFRHCCSQQELAVFCILLIVFLKKCSMRKCLCQFVRMPMMFGFMPWS